MRIIDIRACKRHAAVLLWVLGTSCATARAADNVIYYPPVETHLIKSKHIPQTFKIQVMRPPQTKDEKTRFPVVYATDGNLTFDLFKGISHLIQSADKEGLRFILVGVGYEGDSPMAGAVLRAREMTFPGYPQLAIKPPPIDGVLVAPAGAKDFYGAPEFQKFFEQELFPLIDQNYPTLPGQRTYFGHSGGGGFGLYTLVAQPQLFNNYILSSSGLIYHGVSPAGIKYDNYQFAQQELQKFLDSGKKLNGVKLYMSVGLDEEYQPGLEQWALTSSFYRVTRFLQDHPLPGVELITETFPGANHSTVWPLAFMNGVQAVLGKRPAQ